MKQKEALFYTKTKKESLEGVLKRKKKRRLCDHKINSNSMVDPIGNPENQDVRCRLCGDEFSVKPKSRQEVTKLIRGVQDMLNDIKLTGSTVHEDSLPKEILEQIADVQVFLDNLPKIYEKLFLSIMQPEDDFDEYKGNSLSNGIIIGTPVTRCGRETMNLYYKKKDHKKNHKNKKGKKKKHKNIDKDILSLLD